jgi:hypothetical protein
MFKEKEEIKFIFNVWKHENLQYTLKKFIKCSVSCFFRSFILSLLLFCLIVSFTFIIEEVFTKRPFL